MTTLWREELIPINPFTRPGTKLRLVRNIVIHWTANMGASAANHVRYFGQTLPVAKDRYASAHIFIDPVDSVLIIPLDEVAYHAEQANPYSIGIEMCVEKDGSFNSETVRRAVAVTAALCKQYGLNPLRDVIRHFDVTGKICPRPYVDDPAAWEAFRASVDRATRGETEDEAMKQLPVGIANNIIESYLSKTWFQFEEERKKAEAEGRTQDAASWLQLRDWQHHLANELRKASGLQ